MKKYLAFAAAALLASAPASAATLIVEDGILTGATGVDVAGTLYDVSFIDGSCTNEFSGCDSVADDFAFNTLEAATLGSQALLDQVLLGIYDTNPELIRGCTEVAGCRSFVPYAIEPDDVFIPDVRSAYAQNTVFVPNSLTFSTSADYTGRAVTDIARTYFPNTGSNWARFTLASAVAPVPEPSTWAMMLIGFGGMGVSLRRRRKRSTQMTQMA